MNPAMELFSLPAIFLIALLYSSVGHGGASGYLALLAISGMAPEQMRSSALMLNICVSGIAFIRFRSSGHFSWRHLWPFAVGSIPMAFLGAGLLPDPSLYRKLLAICLLFAVFRIFFPIIERSNVQSPPIMIAVLIGASIGLLSGVVGIGGGIILSPLLLIFGWSNAHQAAAISALFILVNSITGLFGLQEGIFAFGTMQVAWILAAILGGLAGSFFGAKRASDLRLRQVLGSVLILASVKIFIT